MQRNERNQPNPTTGTQEKRAFAPIDWALTLIIALIWGSSFLWIAVGLDSFSPWAVAFARVALGAAALWIMPATRAPIPATAWPTIGVVAVAGNAAPAALFALAQRTVDSSVAGMINAATPIAVLIVGVIATRRAPGPIQMTGIAIGFVGVATIAVPNITGAEAQPSGVALLMVAILGYGVSNNVIVGPQQRYGSLPVVGRALLISAILLAPLGLPPLVQSRPTIGSLGALMILGILGTGVARSLNATLMGRTGAARGSIPTYLIPVVAIALGTVVRAETIDRAEIVGTVVVLAGAWLITRATRSRR